MVSCAGRLYRQSSLFAELFLLLPPDWAEAARILTGGRGGVQTCRGEGRRTRSTPWMHLKPSPSLRVIWRILMSKPKMRVAGGRPILLSACIQDHVRHRSSCLAAALVGSLVCRRPPWLGTTLRHACPLVVGPMTRNQIHRCRHQQQRDERRGAESRHQAHWTWVRCP